MKILVDGTELVNVLHEVRIEGATLRDVNKVIRTELNAVRKKVVEAAGAAMKSDRRRARQAVKVRMYKQVAGGNVSIMYLSKVRQMAVEGSQSTGGQSGIRRRRKVSSRTRALNAYRGADRAFILRFINAGTVQRTTSGKGMKPANRGTIEGKGFFGKVARPAVQSAGTRLVTGIEKVLKDKAGR